MSEHRLTVIGPVNAGKTTYFAALYFLLKNAGNHYNMRIDPTKVVEDRSYLTEISQHWAKLEEIPHTTTGTWKTLELPLQQIDTGQRLVVYLPDMAGEMFRDALKAREWPSDYLVQLEASDRLLLFIGRKDYRETMFLDEEWVGHLEADPTVRPKEWEASEDIIPSDVFYTDLVQQVFYHNAVKRYRLAIIISAWDELLAAISEQDKALYNDPDTYFVERFPLLNQFLESHKDTFNVKVFGVSAYGGNQVDGAAREALEDVDPHERVQIVTAGVLSRNITLPLQYLLDND